jgi:hypothetical protein
MAFAGFETLPEAFSMVQGMNLFGDWMIRWHCCELYASAPPLAFRLGEGVGMAILI